MALEVRSRKSTTAFPPFEHIRTRDEAFFLDTRQLHIRREVVRNRAFKHGGEPGRRKNRGVEKERGLKGAQEVGLMGL